MKQLLKDLEKAIKGTSPIQQAYLKDELIPWAIEWAKRPLPEPGEPTTQDDGGSTPPPPPPHK